VLLAYLPVVMFWVLDERLFRHLYDQVRAVDANAVDFSIDTRPFKREVDGWFLSCFSLTLLLFHGVMFVAVVIFTFALGVIG